MRAKEQAIWFGVALIALMTFVYLFGSILMPFLVGAAIAYLLDPAADWLEARGLSRIAATALITVCVVLLMLLGMIVIIPLLIEQIQSLIETLPIYAESLRVFLQTQFPDALADGSPVREAIRSGLDTMQTRALSLFNNVISSSLVIVNFVALLFFTPVVAFYLLLDWDKMVAQIDTLLPRDYADEIRNIAREVDRVLAGFVRGQLSVCAILGVAYAIALMVVGLQFGLVIGLFAGLVSFIPFVGSILGGAMSIGVALFQFWGEWWLIGIVAVIFVAGQMIEGNVLTPNLVGSSVGLHPVWLIFALSAAGSLMGFTGMLIAVPLAAAIGVLVRWALAKYRSGRFFLGRRGVD